MAVDILSALNTNGTGLNLSALASDLAQAEFSPRKSMVQSRIDKAEVSITGLDRLRSQLGELSSTMQAMSSFETITAKSDSASVGVTMLDPALAPTQASTIDVLATAKNQVLEFSGFTDPEQDLGGGALTVHFGEWEGTPPTFTQNSDLAGKTITFQPGSTLQDMADALSLVDGVTARVLDIGDGTYSLGVISDTGATRALRFTADPSADPGIAQFDFSADPTPVQVRNASDALVAVDGILVSRASNEIDDLIPGVQLNLLGATDTTATISVETDPEMAVALMQTFVDTFNATRTAIKDLTNRGYVEGEDTGALAGDLVPTTVLRNLTSLLGRGIDGFGDEPVYLARLGVQTLRDGTLYLDTDQFEEVMTDNPVLFESVMRDGLRTAEPGVTLSGMPAGSATPGRYDFFRDPATGEATIGGYALTATVLDDGRTEYSMLSGPFSGMAITVEDSVTSAKIDFGRSFANLMTSAIDEATASGGSIDQREQTYNARIASETAEMETLDEKMAEIEARYKERFTQMETVVSQLNATGDYLESLVDAWNNSNN